VISYAQNFEDVILNRAFGGRSKGFYIDVGAWDPVVDSVTKYFYDLGWSGINVEPAADAFRALQAERSRDLNLRVALGDRKETRDFYDVANSGLSTFRRDLLSDLPKFGFDHVVRSVDVTTLEEVCLTHVDGPIDFMKIDVEGWEEAVIRGGDWQKFRPAVLVIEAVLAYPGAFCSPNNSSFADSEKPAVAQSSFVDSLSKKGYDLCYFDGLNEFYVSREAQDLRDLISVPPNVFDGFVPFRQIELEQKLSQAQETVDNLKCRLGIEEADSTSKG